jgi:hypothetical protein
MLLLNMLNIINNLYNTNKSVKTKSGIVVNTRTISEPSIKRTVAGSRGSTTSRFALNGVSNAKVYGGGGCGCGK